MLNLSSSHQVARLGRIFFWGASLLWAAVAGFTVYRAFLKPSLTPDWVFLVLAALMLVNAALLFAFGWAVGQNPPRGVSLAFFYSLLNLVSFFADQFGLPDLLVFLYHLLLTGILARLFWLRRKGF